MWEIVAVGDVHEGMNFGYAIDPKTGLSARALDIHNNFVEAARRAIENHAKLFIVLGDLFDRTHVSPTFREIIRRDVVEPLEQAGIEMWILAGNHDQPHSPGKGTSIDDFRGYPGVSIFRKRAVRTLDMGGSKLRFLILPYLHPTFIASIVHEKFGDEVGPDEVMTLGQRILHEWMASEAKVDDCDHLILLGHYYIETARLRKTSSPECLPGEFGITRSMIPASVNLTLLGHVHLHQEVFPGVVYTGAVERVDWGERGDPKGFVRVDVTDKLQWRFEELPTRDMVLVDVDTSKADGDPTEAIIASLPEDVEGMMLRLRVKLPEGGRRRIDESRIAQLLSPAFRYEVRWEELTGDKRQLTTFSLDPYALLREYLDLNYRDHPRYDDLMSSGEELLREVLG